MAFMRADGAAGLIVRGVATLGDVVATRGTTVAESRSFITSDGARLQNLKAGPFVGQTAEDDAGRERR
jgi:Na+-transporting NADH:ubiquinone oxidoreductase subunit NqrA